MIAEEITDAREIKAILGGSRDLHTQVAPLFFGTTLELEVTEDMQALAIAGVLKNIYAIALGLNDALLLGANMKGVLVTYAIREMQTVLRHFDFDQNMSLSFAGLGDLVTTGVSKFSSNHALGVQIASGQEHTIKGEGCVALPIMLEMLQDTTSVPLMSALQDIIQNDVDPLDALHNIEYR